MSEGTLNLDRIFFCHGAPGSARDAELLQTDTTIVAPNLFEAPSGDVVGHAIAALDQASDEAPFHVVGFSIGAMVAIKIAAARPKKVCKLTLISAAVPLQLGAFLPDMAGKPVFDLAMNRPLGLKALTTAQSVLSRVAPGFLINQLFGKCGAAERDLMRDPAFRDILKDGFKNSFGRNASAYTSLLRTYVTDWSDDMNHVTCPVAVWHGEGDTWSPLAMAHALDVAFGGSATLNIVKNAEHYSTLVAARPTL